MMYSLRKVPSPMGEMFLGMLGVCCSDTQCVPTLQSLNASLTEFGVQLVWSLDRPSTA